MKRHRTRLSGLLLAPALILAAAGLAPAHAEAPLMTVDQLQAVLGDSDVVILDVRAGQDWASSEFKIEGAVRADPEFHEEWAETYPRSKQIVLYCA